MKILFLLSLFLNGSPSVASGNNVEELASPSIFLNAELSSPYILQAGTNQTIPSLIVQVFGEGPCAITLDRETLARSAIDPKELKSALFSRSQTEHLEIPANSNFSEFKICSKETTSKTLSFLTSVQQPVEISALPSLAIFGISYYAFCSALGFGIDKAKIIQKDCGAVASYECEEVSGSEVVAVVGLIACAPVSGINKMLRWVILGDREGWSPYYLRGE